MYYDDNEKEENRNNEINRIAESRKQGEKENYKYEMHSIRFQTFFVWVFTIVLAIWKFRILLLYILWDDWPILMISASNEHLQQQLEYTLLIVTAGEFQKCNLTL